MKGKVKEKRKRKIRKINKPQKNTQDPVMIGYMKKYRNKKVAKKRKKANKIQRRNRKEKLQNLKKNRRSLFNRGKIMRKVNHK